MFAFALGKLSSLSLAKKVENISAPSCCGNKLFSLNQESLLVVGREKRLISSGRLGSFQLGMTTFPHKRWQQRRHRRDGFNPRGCCGRVENLINGRLMTWS